MFADCYSDICNSLPFADINGDHSLPAQGTKRVLERDELYKGLRSKAVVKSRVVFSYPKIMFWFSICECTQWIGNIQMESKHETTRQWMHRFVEVFWPCGSRNAQVFQPIRGQNGAIMTNERARQHNDRNVTNKQWGWHWGDHWSCSATDTGHQTAHTSSHLLTIVLSVMICVASEMSFVGFNHQGYCQAQVQVPIPHPSWP